MSKEYTTDNIYIDGYLSDGSGSGTSGQVLSSTGGGVSWVDGSGTIIGGPYLPLSAGASYPLTGDLYLKTASNQGNLFFGTADASYKIFGGGTYGYMGYNTGGYHRFLVSGAEKMRIASTGNVGIGTTNPNNILELYKTVDSGIGPILQLTNTQYANANDSGSSIQFRGYTSWGPGSTNPRYSEINAINGGGSVPKRIEFKFYADTDVKTPLAILQTGRVGIGTTSPTSPLTIKSNSTSSSLSGLTIQANGNTNNIFQLGEKSTDGSRLEMLDAGVVKIALHSDGTDNYINAGNVGIGTTSPGYKLDVAGTFQVKDANSAVVIQEYSSGATIWMDGVDGDFVGGDYFNISAYGATDLAFGHSAATKMTLKSTGNLGIGTTSPSSPLHIAKTTTWGEMSNPIINIENNGTGGNINIPHNMGSITWKSGSVSTAEIKAVRNTPASGDNVELRFSTSSAGVQGERMTIDNVGNVGIGTTSPSKKLEVNGDAKVINGAILAAQAYGINLGASGYDILMPTTTRIAIRAGASERISILNTGKVGIGTTNPLANLDISNDAGSVYQQWSYDNPGANNYNLTLSETVTSGNVRFCFNQRNAGTNYDNVLVFNQGNVGIGTDSPFDSKLQVVGKIRAAGGTSGGYFFGSEEFDGGFYAPSDGNLAFSTNSSERIRIDGNGNVGIGTTLPGAALEVNAQGTGNGIGGYTSFKTKYGTTSVQSLSIGQVTAGNGAWIGMAQYRNGGYWQTEGTAAGVISLDSGGNITFATNAGLTANTDYTITERMRIDSAGAIKFNAYGAGTLVTDASGNITASSGGGAGGPYLPLAGGTVSGTAGTGASLVTIENTSGSTATSYGLLVKGGGNSSSGKTFEVQDSSGNSDFIIKGNGNVGIGVTGPSAPLEIAAESTNVGNTLLSIGNTIVNPNTRDSWIKMFGSQTTVDKTFAVGNMYGKFVVNYLGTRATNPESGGTKMFTVDGSNGNVGIGTASPQTTLHLYDTGGSILRLSSDAHTDNNKIEFDAINNGSIYHSIVSNTNSGNLQIRAGDGGSGHEVNIYTDGLFAATFDNNQNLGIGTTNPVSTLQIVATTTEQTTAELTDAGSRKGLLTLSGLSNQVAGAGGGIVFAGNNTTSYAAIKGLLNNGGGNTQGSIAFSTRDLATDTSLTERMRVHTNGNVGIGTASPGVLLDVLGDVMFGSGNRFETATNVFKGPAGQNGIMLRSAISTAANPSYTNVDDANTGMFLPGSDVVGFTTAATERMRIDSAGNVGIGTTSPGAKLHVVGSGNGVGIKLSGDPSAGGAYYYGIMHDGTNLRGTTQTNLLFTEGSVLANTTIATWASLRIANPSTAATGAVITNNYGIYQESSVQKNYFNGNVGIGTTNPGAKLHVYTSGVNRVFIESDNNANQVYQSSAGLAGYNQYTFGQMGGTIASPTQLGGGYDIGNIIFQGYDGAAMRSVAGIRIRNSAIITSTSSPADMHFETTTAGSVAQTTKMTILSGGNVGIGTTLPGTKLQVNGRIKADEGVQVGNETSTTASLALVGTLRYRGAIASGLSTVSVVEMCMQTGSSTFAWKVIYTTPAF